MPVLLIFFAFIALVVLMPFGLIWALNTLFAFGIGYTLSTWFAAFLLILIAGGARASYKTDS